MKYEKNQYTEGVSICGFIIAGAFLWWGISTLMPPDVAWWGIIPIAIGIAILSGIIRAILNKKKLRRVVKDEFESNPNASIEELSDKTGISKKDVRAIILDLKASGELKGKFSTKTGKMKVVPPEATQEKGKVCSTCGTSVSKETAEYCPYCGSKIG